MNDLLFNPRKYEERFFWTFKEVLTGLGEEQEDFLYNIDYLDEVVSVMVEEGYSTPIWDSEHEKIKNDYRDVLDLVIKRFLTHYCYYTLSEEFDISKAKNFIAKLVMVLEMTSPRYLKLLEVYEASKNKLLDPVEIASEGITRFNDTPQDEGDFANDEHTTNLTEDSRSTKNDLDSKMGRIKEIESSYNNLLLNWSNEFESIFLEENNI